MLHSRMSKNMRDLINAYNLLYYVWQKVSKDLFKTHGIRWIEDNDIWESWLIKILPIQSACSISFDCQEPLDRILLFDCFYFYVSQYQGKLCLQWKGKFVHAAARYKKCGMCFTLHHLYTPYETLRTKIRERVCTARVRRWLLAAEYNGLVSILPFSKPWTNLLKRHLLKPSWARCYSFRLQVWYLGGLLANIFCVVKMVSWFGSGYLLKQNLYV